MNPVDSNAGNGFINVSYPLDLVNQARKVMLDANRELFSANAADISEPPAEFSQLSTQLSSRLEGFSTLLSSTDFFSESFSSQGQTATKETEDSAFSKIFEDSVLDGTDMDEVFSSLDIDAQEQSVRTVINAYNGLIEWLDSSQYTISPSLKADLFKDMNSEVLTGIISSTSAVQENAAVPRVEGTASQTQQTDLFSPQVSGTSDYTVESALSKIGLALNTDGTLDVEDGFEQQFKADFNLVYAILSGEEGFFTHIGSALDMLQSRDRRFNAYTQVYTRNADVQVRNIYRTNIASLLNTFA